MRLRTLLATVVTGTLAVGLAGTAQADPVLDPAEAGKVIAWGDEADAAAELAMAVPDLPAPVVSVATNDRATAVVTADGSLRVFGNPDDAEVAEAPIDEITDATSVSLTQGSGAVVHADGRVTAWGASPDLNDVPTDLRAKAISLAATTGYAVTTDGTLRRWGNVNPDDGIPALPPADDLTDLKDVSAGLFQVLALHNDGTVEGWANPFFSEFFAVPFGDDKLVDQIATGISANGVVFKDGSIEVWGMSVPADEPAFTDETVIGLDLYTNAGAVTDDGTVYSWGSVGELTTNRPDLAGQPVATIAMGDKHAAVIVTDFRDLSKPAVSGTPQVGQTLTATPATFSLTPDGPATGQWYAGADPIAGQTGTTLTLSQALVGKTITYRSTATRAGETVTSVSNEVGPVVLVASTTTLTVTPATGEYGSARTATATVAKVGGTPTGTVTFTLGGTASTATLSGGTATWALPATLAVGTQTMTATYGGDATTAASTSAGVAVTVDKATSRLKAGKAKVKGKKAHKKVTIKLTVKAPEGVSPKGKVTVTLKGKTKKKVTAKVNAQGKAKVTFKKVKHGKYKAKLKYAGNANVAGDKATKKFKV